MGRGKDEAQREGGGTCSTEHGGYFALSWHQRQLDADENMELDI